MASVVFSAVGSAVGGPPGQIIGAQIGRFIDSKLLDSGSKLAGIEGARLKNLAVQSSTYGEMIPVLYGTVRNAGNIIWSQPIEERSTKTTSSAGGKGGGGVKQSTTEFSYYVTLAIAICEGPIDEVLRVWADANAVDPNDIGLSYTLYKGDEDQLPDSVMEAFEGVGNVPAYRGLAYVVIEDFPLVDYGNRIPNFTFEVKRKALQGTDGGTPVEQLIKSMIMIPGSGEFVYDTTVQKKVTGEESDGEFIQSGTHQLINQNNTHNKSDALVSLDQLGETCPNLEWIGVVVTWFGDNMDAGVCTIKPGVEFKSGAITDPEAWNVAGYDRDSAQQITLIDGSPRYGGTPDDESLLRYLDELNSRGYNIMFYPMFFMDVENKPWRGRVTGSASDVASFFTKTNGYNAFINHYANLVKDKVDAFVIGSELIGLTKVQDVDDSFPAVDELVNLAASVKGIVGSGVKVTYAADWSEYHHTDGGWYNLDPLWASSNIDFIGIDAYFPLTDEPQDGYDLQKVMDGWTSGEGYDWYYTDPERTTTASLADEYAWKNIQWWWENTHTNPDMVQTGWVPESKPIWFTEYGFPSVDGATNQPNVFYDPDSSESAFPRFSIGQQDLRAQRLGLEATELKWASSSMIEQMFVWTWDARPYPYWPDLESIWADGQLWTYGHWVQGKLGLSNLGAIVSDVCQRAGLAESDFDVTELTDLVDGYILTNQLSFRKVIESLQTAYQFDAIESDGKLKFVKRGRASSLTIPESDVVPAETSEGLGTITSRRVQELELPQKVDVNYLSRTLDYDVGNQHSSRTASNSNEKVTLNLQIVLSDQTAKAIADITLFNSWLSRQTYEFNLPYDYADLEPTDVVTITTSTASYTLRITDVQAGRPGILRVKGVAEELAVYSFNNVAASQSAKTKVIEDAGATNLQLLDLPALPNDSALDAYLSIAATGNNASWKGGVIYRSDDDGSSYKVISEVATPATQGTALNALAEGTTALWDNVNSLTILLVSGELESNTEMAVLNGANTALVGNEIIQFKTATLIQPGKYTLSGLLRGRLGTEHETANHATNERFILLDAAVERVKMAEGLIGLERPYKPVTIGKTLAGTNAQNFAYSANALKPYSPVHVSGTRNGGGDLSINWIRRTRVGGAWRDGVDVPLSEESEQYEIDIMNGSAVVRTITGLTSPQATYSGTDQTTDFGSPQSSIDMKIYQLSAVVGRGHPRTTTL